MLYAATARLGIMEHLEYDYYEFEERGTESCEVTVHIGASEKHLHMRPWSVTTPGHRMQDACQIATRKALR